MIQFMNDFDTSCGNPDCPYCGTDATQTEEEVLFEALFDLIDDGLEGAYQAGYSDGARAALDAALATGSIDQTGEFDPAIPYDYETERDFSELISDDGAEVNEDLIESILSYVEAVDEFAEATSDDLGDVEDFLVSLVDELDTWAPGVDERLAGHDDLFEKTGVALEKVVEFGVAVNAEISALTTAVADITEGMDEKLEELEADAAADAAYLDSLGLMLQTVLARLDRVEDVTGARAVPLRGTL